MGSMSLESSEAAVETLGSAPIPAEHRRSPGATVWTYSGYAYVACLILIAIFAPVLAPQSPINQTGDFLAGPSASHWLGTDDVGRDVLSRLIWGTRPALEGVAIAMTTCCLIGIPWGVIAGYTRPAVDISLMRVADIFLSFPALILTIAITAALGIGLRNAMIALGVATSPALARVMRVGVLAVRNRDYVRITRVMGYSKLYSAVRHVLPNAFAPVLVQIVILAGLALLAQTTLGFLGLEDPPPAPSWGNSLASAYQHILAEPTATLAPGIVVSLAVLAIYRVGDDLRDRLDIFRESS